ncbi:caspase family protein [Robertkochia sediminum]|uniref:caspase family protein n=1 Tax=Robertkochia sediminum TaxID=2785326 RepID=UPI001931CD34|nr:caspase family protein [Robertkochia sediminum]MBL7473090.1 caspase family protein [Robertkochia sediminum]
MKVIIFIPILLLFFNDSNISNQTYTQKKNALLIGMTTTNLSHLYSNTATSLASSNISRINNILKKEKFNIKELDSPNSTEFLEAIKESLSPLKEDDFLVIYYYGHGGQVIDDPNDWDLELDGLDETFVTRDREVKDDELYEILLQNRNSPRVLMIIDACNSGTSYKMRPELPDFTYKNSYNFLDTPQIDKFKVLKPNLKAQLDRIITLDLIYLSSSSDGMAIPSDTFSKVITRIWNNGNFKGDYNKFFSKIKDKSYLYNIYPTMDTSNASSNFINSQILK